MELLKQARIILSLAAITLTNQTLAEQRIDYDIDDDGLIEINTLEDLNQIRNEFDTATRLIKGTHLYGKNDGCPVTEERNGCHGYELTSDLSFDTNNNGQFDEGDSFWNDGKGFAPFGQYSPKFGAEFHGNGFTIRHLYMNYPDQRFVGLFSYNEMSYIHDLTLQAEIIGGMHSGSLLGHGWQTRVENIKASVKVSSADDQVGGLVGILEEGSSIKNVIIDAEMHTNFRTGGVVGRTSAVELSDIAAKSSFTNFSTTNDAPGWRNMGAITGWSDTSNYQAIYTDISSDVAAGVGGIIGVANKDKLKNLLVTGKVTSASSAAGIIGSDYSESMQDTVEISNAISLLHVPEEISAAGLIRSDSRYKSALFSGAYWATDLTNSNQRIGNDPAGTSTVLASDIQCATADVNCNGLQFGSFKTATNDAGETLWQFGSNTEAPQVLLMGHLYGDRDTDGSSDTWPQIITAPTNPEPEPEPEPEPQPEPNPTPGKDDNDSSGGAILWLLLLVLPVLTTGRSKSGV
ncbi:MAG: hypothetical protein MK185_07590 [Saccharospirillaceae bacterium]|nr:hypothetical protein [Saccharospirillaceae bacterium]